MTSNIANESPVLESLTNERPVFLPRARTLLYCIMQGMAQLWMVGVSQARTGEGITRCDAHGGLVEGAFQR